MITRNALHLTTLGQKQSSASRGKRHSAGIHQEQKSHGVFEQYE